MALSIALDAERREALALFSTVRMTGKRFEYPALASHFPLQSMNSSPSTNIATYRGDEIDVVCIKVLKFSCIYLNVGSAVKQWGILFGATLCCVEIVMLEKLDCILSKRAARPIYMKVQVRLNAISPYQSQQSSPAIQDISVSGHTRLISG